VSTRLDRRFAAREGAEGRAAFVTFVMAGDPDPATSLAILEGAARGRRGRDRARHAVLGPDGRGPGRSRRPRCARSHAGHDAARDARSIVRDFRTRDDDTPIILMGYFNPIYVYGVDAFLRDAWRRASTG
jgi:tryptophan synthase alpha chain